MEELNIRDTLFGDIPIFTWAGLDSSELDEPWNWFLSTDQYLKSGNKTQAVKQLERILETPGLESRHYLQAWHVLRQQGVIPPNSISKQVIGVVIEVSLADGLDLVAAYADHSARYFNFSGAGVIWDNPDGSLNKEIDALLNAAESIIHNIGPWEESRPPPPPQGQVRVNMLTPGGLHFGQAPYETLANDESGGPIIMAALELMQSLIDKSTQASA